MTSPASSRGVIGVDVGTGSARAGVFDLAGRLLGSAKRPITIWHENVDVVEQSSEQIWQAVAQSVREAVAASGLRPGDIAGIGFDATCSLVAVKADGTPVTVSPSGDAARNIMVWMDHRAARQAEEINVGGHDVLRYVGGRISPEMETPKLVWLKRNLPDSFAAADHFFDLADYLTWRASGSAARSICTVTCKWTYLAHERRWDAEFFRAVGLGELADENFARIGAEIVEAGSSLGDGLTAEAAADLGLMPGTPVAAALIDAHAGGVGTLGTTVEGTGLELGSRLAYVFGTSACSMASASEPVFVPGVWGPYFSAMVPGLWLNEGGQSAAGAAIDHLVSLHAAAPDTAQLAAREGLTLVEWLDREASRLAASPERVVELAGSIHVVPEFLGNRSPHADPDARAVIAGLGIDRDVASLVALYVAGVTGIGYGLRQLLDRFAADGIAISTILASGGAARSPLVCQMLADATGVPVAVAETSEPVLLGSAMLASVAAGGHPSLVDAMRAMSGTSVLFRPAQGHAAERHRQRYAAFEILQKAARQIR
ncbi:FGGY-family carbohydrate kinase [Devosia naphthalenivorans]|uniref:FGGY-family carbohydrate kinase n=1 Tax=Devosia naphthalenivorans TaxID=2082392 RepID=UPI000D3940B0|nr:FGGY-family carbohydrate kinase [Devosia naphthalenivorans]